MREHIEDLLWANAQTIDDDRLEDWPGFFIEDARYRIISRGDFDRARPIGVMLCDGRGMMEDRVNAPSHREHL